MRDLHLRKYEKRPLIGETQIRLLIGANLRRRRKIPTLLKQ